MHDPRGKSPNYSALRSAGVTRVGRSDQRQCSAGFQADLDGVYIQGVNILRWNAKEKAVSFTVIARAAKAGRADGRSAGRWRGLTIPVLAHQTPHPAASSIDSTA